MVDPTPADLCWSSVASRTSRWLKPSYPCSVSDTLVTDGGASCCRRGHGHGPREAPIRPGSAQGVSMEPRARRAVRSSRCWWAPLRRCPPSSTWSSDGGKKVRPARAPAQDARMLVARSDCACAAPEAPPARPDLQLTTPACVSSAAPVLPGDGSMTSPDQPKTAEHLYQQQGVGAGASTPSRRALAGCATMLLCHTVAEQRQRRAGGWWRGGGPAGGRRLAASRWELGHWGRLGAWASVRGSWSPSGVCGRPPFQGGG